MSAGFNYDNWKSTQPLDRAGDYAQAKLDRMSLEDKFKKAVELDLIEEDSPTPNPEDVEQMLFDYYCDEYWEAK